MMNDFFSSINFAMSIEVLEDSMIQGVGVEATDSDGNFPLAGLSDGGGSDTSDGSEEVSSP